MIRPVILFAICVILAFCLIGCGGGSSSSVTESSLNTSSSPQPQPLNQFSSLVINPIADLGLTTGEKVCFSVKSYNNVTESDYSKAICGKINNDNKLTLSWNKIAGDVNGYYVYYGTNKNNATNFLADVMES